MPYKNDSELPSWLKKYPKHERDTFRESFNSSYLETNNESTALQIAGRKLTTYNEITKCYIEKIIN